MEEWKKERENKKAARLEERAKNDQRWRQYKEERALFVDDLKKQKDENAIDIKNAIKDENLSKDKNTTYPMDKLGTHVKNVDEVSNTLNSEKVSNSVSKVARKSDAKINKVDSEQIENRKARQHNMNKNLGNVQNPTYPMDKNIGTNIKNVAEVTNSHESAKFKSTPARAPADTLDLKI